MSEFQISLIFAFTSMALWGVGDFLIQKTIRKIGSLPTLLWINLIAGLSLFPFVLKDFPVIFIWSNLSFLIIITIVGLLYSIFLFKAYDQGKLAVIEMIMVGELPLTIILGLIFFHERLNWIQVLAILVIIIGILLISKSQKDGQNKIRDFFAGKKLIWEKGVLLAAAAVSFSALYNFLTVVTSRNISAFTAIWFPWMLGSIFLLIYIAYKRGLKSFWQISINHKILILFTAIIDATAWIFYALATENEELSVVTPIIAGYAVVAMALGVKFNKERIGVWQYFGIVLVILGVIIVSLISG
ncbi:MAG: DMT family transporter [Patescibacteria group bacterium]|jgi:drug/metabolite transporter (DMT)-like permease